MIKEALLKRAEILCVGTELLLGEVVNTNASDIAKVLADCGIDLLRTTVVADNAEQLKDAIGEALSRCDLLVTSGGLGPTYDDITRDVCAAYLGLPMQEDEAVLASVEAYFRKRHMKMPESNHRQAMVPSGATVFENSKGTAPGLAAVSADGSKTVIMLPGPPRELVPMLRTQIAPYLEKRSGSTIRSKNLYLFGISESAAEAILNDMMTESKNPTVATYLNGHEVHIRITAKADSAEKSEDMCRHTAKQIKASELGKYIYGDGSNTLEEAVVYCLREKKKTIAFAETCTGGLCAKRIVDVSGASEVFLGSIVSYSPESKHDLLGVPEHTLEDHTEVSRQAAARMASGVREQFGTDIGVAVVGYAGPGGGTEEKPVGTVYIAYSTHKHDAIIYKYVFPNKGRDYIRAHGASRALSVILENNR